jgi:hypothetical protein|tara:strand:- start:1216 stop:1935 length:720 start_codon:yes stop_codon:yes gene_type:complete
MTQRREKFSLAKTITTIRSYSTSRIAFDALDCLFTRENVSSLRFLTVRVLSETAYYLYSSQGKGIRGVLTGGLPLFFMWVTSFFRCKMWTSSFFSSFFFQTVNPKLLQGKNWADFQNHIKNLYLSLFYIPFLPLRKDEVGVLFPKNTTTIRRRSFLRRPSFSSLFLFFFVYFFLGGRDANPIRELRLGHEFRKEFRKERARVVPFNRRGIGLGVFDKRWEKRRRRGEENCGGKIERVKV